MHAFVISLRRTPDRLRQFRTNNPTFPEAVHFEAIEGSEWPTARLIAEHLANGPIAYTPGAIGNALSHRALWLRAVANDEPVTICEDDAVLHADFAEQSKRFVAHLGQDWDVVYWGWNFDGELVAEIANGLTSCRMQFDQVRMRAAKRTYLDGPVRVIPMHLVRAFGTLCYSISPGGAQRFLEGCFPIRDFAIRWPMLDVTVRNIALDVSMNALHPRYKSFVCFPPLAVSDNDHSTSTVSRSADMF